jgi:hypothetical protein
LFLFVARKKPRGATKNAKRRVGKDGCAEQDREMNGEMNTEQHDNGSKTARSSSTMEFRLFCF